MVLVEARKLALPNTGPGTRWVSGWLFDDEPRGLTIRPAADSARLEVVHLRPRSRTLSLGTRTDASGLEVQATIGSRRLESVTSSTDIEISLPGDLAQGRHVIDLEFTAGADVAISGAALSTAARVGTVTLEGSDVIQQPWSIVDIVRWVGPDTALVGDFVPPSNATPDQRFALKLERGDGEPETVMDVRADDGIVPIRAQLRTSAGLVRIRLVAEGQGAAGRWRELRLQHREAAVKTAAVGLPEAPKIVVVYVLDALRADVIGHLGSDQGATPCLDRLAAEGAAFTNHFSVAPNTGPATISLFTGYGFLRGRAIPEDGPLTLAETFAAAGFRTVSVSSNPHLSASYGLIRGFEDVIFEPIDEDFGEGAGGEPTVNDSADRVHGAALSWLDGLHPDDRAFLYLHTLNPHNPYTPPEPYPSLFLRSEGSLIDGGTKTLADIRDLEVSVSPEDVRRIGEWYTAGVAYNDAALCGLADELERRFGDEVLLVVTSDHGEELFDHDGVLHGYTLYDELLRVPLVVWWPGRVLPARIEGATDTLDLSAGLRSLVDAENTGTPDSGASMWTAITGGNDWSREPALHFATAPGLRRAAMVRSDRWKVIVAPRPRFEWGMGRGRGRTHDAEYVFNLTEDPGEIVNRAGDSNLEVDWLRSRLQGWMGFWEAQQPVADDGRLDEATRRRLEALGYTD